ncbi:MAG: hypothetical protein ABSF48_16400 [Thermodesulfobacteriota bacterium]|jgi:hypothetical protein
MQKRTEGLKGICITIIFLFTFWGCDGGGKILKPQGTRSDVFTEAKNSIPPPQGTVSLEIRASVKTPTSEHYLLEFKTPPQVKDGYPFELNIDGQEIIWKEKGKLEKTPISGEQGRFPEGGEGIRYVLDRTIFLAPGPHHIVFGLPADDFYTEVKISLREEEPHVLEFHPVYAMGRHGYRTFFHGVTRSEIFLDKTRIK